MLPRAKPGVIAKGQSHMLLAMDGMEFM